MYKIRKDNTSKKNHYYCVLFNPFLGEDYCSSIHIDGSSYDIVERKVQKQLKIWEKSKDDDIKKIEENKKYYEKIREDNKNNDDLPF